MKYEWRKEEKGLYIPKSKPEIVDVPRLKFITIAGAENPNSEGFKQAITALYPVAYNIRLKLKTGWMREPFEYTVYPLEGVWTTSDGSRDDHLNKDMFVYKIMIRQPDIVTKELFEAAMKAVKVKKPNVKYDEIIVESYEEGKSVQMLHLGPFDKEIETIRIMRSFIKNNNLKEDLTMEKYHH